MKSGTLGIVGYTDFCVGKLAKRLYRFHVRCAHVCCRNNAEPAATVRKTLKVIDD